MMRHKGARPQRDFIFVDEKRKLYYEQLPDGKIKLWTKRSLKSGCGKVTKEIREMQGCYYCWYCDEWFNKEQWE